MATRFRIGDTQTTSNTWQVGINGPIIKNVSGNTYLRNSTDDGYSDLTLQNLTVLGTALIPVDTSSFTGILTVSDNTVQKAIDTIDKHNHAHDALTGILGDGYYHLTSGQVAGLHTQNTDTGTTSQTFTVYSSSDAYNVTLKAVDDGYGSGALELKNSVGYADLFVKNLTVFGERTIVHSTTVTVEDNILLLNSSVTGTPVLDAGIEVGRGDQTNSTILWDEGALAWKIGLVGSEVEITTISGTQILTNKTLTDPVIGSFISAQHNHQDGYGGGKLDINNATTGTLSTTRGGTGLTSYAAGSLLYSSATDTLASLPILSDGYILTTNSGLPSWSPVSILSQQASNISVSTAAFNHILSASDTDVQLALDTIDDHNHSHNTLSGIDGAGTYHLSSAQVLALHTQNTDTGTSNNSFSVGNGVDTDKTIIANNGDAYLPSIKYSSLNSRWEISDDGINFSTLSDLYKPFTDIQVGKYGKLTPGETNYLLPSYVESDSYTMGYLMPYNMTGPTLLSSFAVKVGTAPGVGENVVFTVLVNGADTTITATISDTSTETGGSYLGLGLGFQVHLFDVINVKAVSSSGSAVENVMITIPAICGAPGIYV